MMTFTYLKIPSGNVAKSTALLANVIAFGCAGEVVEYRGCLVNGGNQWTIIGIWSGEELAGVLLTIQRLDWCCYANKAYTLLPHCTIP